VLTQVRESPGALSWSPDGRRLAFTMRVPAESKSLAELPRKPEGAEWAPAVTLIENLSYRADGAGYTRPGFTHVFVLPAEGGTPRQVTRGEFNHRGRPQWSRDGRSLFVVGNRNADWQRDPQESEIYRIALDSGEATALTSRDGPDGDAQISPDGRRIAYTGFDDRKLGYHQARLYVLEIESGATRALTDDFDHEVDQFGWDRDGRGLYFGYERKGRGHIGWIPASGGKTISAAPRWVGPTAAAVSTCVPAWSRTRAAPSRDRPMSQSCRAARSRAC
jgi:acylaminoacyl-peptidase